MKLMTLAVLSATLLSPVDLPRQPSTVTAVEPLAGRWQLVETAANVPRARVPLSGRDGIEFTGANCHWGKGRAAVRLRPDRTPAEIDVTFLEGREQGGTWRGIFRVEGDTLTILVNTQAGGLRPLRFGEWPEDGEPFLLTLKRQGTP